MMNYLVPASLIVYGLWGFYWLWNIIKVIPTNNYPELIEIRELAAERPILTFSVIVLLSSLWPVIYTLKKAK